MCVTHWDKQTCDCRNTDYTGEVCQTRKLEYFKGIFYTRFKTINNVIRLILCFNCEYHVHAVCLGVDTVHLGPSCNSTSWHQKNDVRTAI